MEPAIQNAIDKLTNVTPYDRNHEFGQGYELGLREGMIVLKELGPQVIGIDTVKQLLEQVYEDAKANGVVDLDTFKEAAMAKFTPKESEQPEADKETEYNFSIKVTGHYRLMARGTSYEEALERANRYTHGANFGALEDIKWEISDVN